MVSAWVDASLVCGAGLIGLFLDPRRVDASYNEGGAYGDVAVAGGVAVWETREWAGTCRLRFAFGADELTVDQDGTDTDCGFGGNVRADGIHYRTSRRPPHFTDASPAEGGKLAMDFQ